MFQGRMLDKSKEPTAAEIAAHIGAAAGKHLELLEQELAQRYDMNRELRFPFGNEYGWGFKYSHKSKHLMYLFFEKDGITATLQIGEGQRVEEILSELSDYARELWADRYPCGKKGGGWIHYQIRDEKQLPEVLQLTAAKCPVPRKKPS